jgi:hypothetical protein
VEHDILAWAGVLSLLLTVVAILAASFKTSRNTVSMSNYRDAAQSWEAKSKAQDIEIAELKEKVANMVTDNTRLSAQIGELRDLVTGRAEWAQLRQDMTGQLTAIQNDTHAILGRLEATHQ